MGGIYYIPQQGAVRIPIPDPGWGGGVSFFPPFLPFSSWYRYQIAILKSTF